MSPRLEREVLPDGSFVDIAVDQIKPDRWRPHGVKYRLAWIQNDVCRVLFDNHHGKADHYHVDGEEKPYVFFSFEQLYEDFRDLVRKSGGLI